MELDEEKQIGNFDHLNTERLGELSNNEVPVIGRGG